MTGRPPRRPYTAEEQAFFAQYREHRSHLRPRACDDGEACWVRDGPPACTKHSARCTGCNGLIGGGWERKFKRPYGGG